MPSKTPLLDRMARRGTRTGGTSSYAEQSARQSHIDRETIASMRQQLAKMYGSVYAWWRLSSEQKRGLDAQRDAGKFGGTPGRAPYMWVQEGTYATSGAAKAGIHPTSFVEGTLNDVQEAVADAIAGALSAT